TELVIKQMDRNFDKETVKNDEAAKDESKIAADTKQAPRKNTK
ncbi:hypothetical protein LCGC14_1220460, partial [marine sediment metagenome]